LCDRLKLPDCADQMPQENTQVASTDAVAQSNPVDIEWTAHVGQARIRNKFGFVRWSIVWVAPAVVVLMILCVGAQWIDAFVANNRKQHGLPGDLRRIIELSEFFAHGFGVAVVLSVIWTLTPQYRRMLPRLAACAILPGLICQVVKLIIVRKRPIYFRDAVIESAGQTWGGLFPDKAHEIDYLYQSFPSAHAATAVGFAIGLSWLFPKGRFIFFGLAILSSIQRAAAGAHWVSDVFAGATIALVICYLIFRRGWIDAAFSRLESSVADTNNDDPLFKSSIVPTQGTKTNSTAA
jgi:membrane-associated phospholipid phosphatase